MNLTCGSILCAIISVYEVTCCGLFAYSLKNNCKKMTYEEVNREEEEDDMAEADIMLNMGIQKKEETENEMTRDYCNFNIKSSLDTLYE